MKRISRLLMLLIYKRKSLYLVRERGAPSETFKTEGYRVYPDVCEYPELLVEEDILRLVRKELVNDRTYKNLKG